MEKSILSAVDVKTQNIKKSDNEKPENRSKIHISKMITPYNTIKSQQKSSSPGNTVSINQTKMSKFTSSEIISPAKPKDNHLSDTMREIEALKLEK
jgi:hypothetical protein